MNENIKVTKKQVNSMTSKIEEMGFWSLETREKIESTVLKTDGAQWVLEGVKSGTDHVTERSSPEEGPYRDTALLLVKLSNLKVAEIY